MKDDDKFAKFPAKKLPTTLRGWIIAAVNDAKSLAKMKKQFRLDMYTFNTFNDKPAPNKVCMVCMVCMGGAVLVGHGLVAPGAEFTRGNLDEDIEASKIAFAIDHVREGNVRRAADILFRESLISWIPSCVALERAQGLINDHFDRKTGRAPWSTYLKAAEIVKHKPKNR